MQRSEIRVAFLTNLTSPVSLPVLSRLSSSPKFELVHTYFYDTLAESRGSLRDVVRQFGWRTVIGKAWHMLSSRARLASARLVGGRWFRARSAYELVRLHGLPHTVVADINHASVQSQLQSLRVEFLVVCVCKNILRSPLLSLPGFRAVNVHPSLLPKYRGPAPTFWMRYHGETRTGVTLHLITPGIDDGDILAQREMALPSESSDLPDPAIELKLFELAAELLEESLCRLSEGSLQPRPQDAAQASYFSYPTPEDRWRLEQRRRESR